MQTVDAQDLIFVDVVRGAGGDTRELRNAARRGDLVRVRRGVYCSASTWAEASSRQRHVLRIHAVLRATQTPSIVAGRSAAAVWGLPTPDAWPIEVCLLSEYRGGGKSEPGVRRMTTAAGVAEPAWMQGIPVTSLARTAIDLSRELRFPQALGCVDAILAHPRGPTLAELWDELERTSPRTKRAAVSRVLHHASALSGSFGESEARGVIIDLGFEPPELQVPFRDEEGEMIPDYLWRRARVAGEFDGKTKFTRDEFTRGHPAEVAWAEKKREDRLRRKVPGVVRILTEHVRNPPALARLLTQAGVPRASGTPLRPQGTPRAAVPEGTAPARNSPRAGRLDT